MIALIVKYKKPKLKTCEHWDTVGLFLLLGCILLCVPAHIACAVSGSTYEDSGVVEQDSHVDDSGPDPTLCGNGIIDPGEVCDDGLPPGQSVCSDDCMRCDGPCTEDEDCYVECHYCDSSGHCAIADKDTDPKDDCEEEAEESCGLTGKCNGKAQCAFYDSSTVCEEGECQGTVVHMTKFCDGEGTCRAGDTIDCAPDECTLHDAPGSGTICGTGEPVVLTNNDTVPEIHTFEGNLLHSGGVNWYRVGAVANEGALSIYAWFETNPEEEFAFEILSGTGNVDDCSDGELQCSSTAPYIRYSYILNKCEESCDELGRNLYIGVKRAPGSTPTCKNYSLKVRTGGMTPPW